MDQFYQRLAEAIDIETVNDDMVFEELDEWDSLTVLSVIAMMDSDYGLTIYADQLKKLRTVADLKEFILASKK